MPSSDNNSHKFTKLTATWVVPLVIYFDFESFLRTVSGCKGPQDKTFKQLKEILEPCGFALTVMDHQLSKLIFHHVDSSPACVTNFIKVLHKLARDIYQQKGKHSRNLGKYNATHCWICEKPFSVSEDPENTLDLDHCHYSGEFFGWEHEMQSLETKYVSPPLLVVMFEIMIYTTLTMNNSEPTKTIRVIPPTDKKNISVMFSVLMNTFVTEKRKTVKVYEYL